MPFDPIAFLETYGLSAVGFVIAVFVWWRWERAEAAMAEERKSVSTTIDRNTEAMVRFATMLEMMAKK